MVMERETALNLTSVICAHLQWEASLFSIFSIMHKEKITLDTPVAGVIPAVAQYLGRYDKEDFTEAPVVVQEMFNDLMGTEHGDSHSYRDRALHTLNIIRGFGETIAPFSQEDIDEAVKPFNRG
jgi:hypothetical protein